MKQLCAVALTATLSFFFLAPASGQTLRISLDALSEASDAVVVGRTLRTESFWNDDRSSILTRVVIGVDESLAGMAGAEQELIVPGGQVGEYLQEVSDMPFFSEGEEVVVFLTQHASGVTIVTGGWQGKLEIVRDPETGARRVLGGAHLFDEDLKAQDLGGVLEQGGEVERVRTTLPIEEFVRRVKKIDER
jgi:hypothetical protein